MKRIGFAAALAVVAALSAGGDRVLAQSAGGQQETLRRQIERRFDVVRLRNSLVLQPKRGDRRVRSIEVSDRSIDVDGAPTTGAELREKLGMDADLVFRLSYLSVADRQRLFGAAASTAPPAAPATPQAPAEPAVPATPSAPAVETPEGRQEEPQRPEDRPGRRTRRGGRENDRVKFGGNISVEEGEQINGDVVAIGGSVRIDGEVSGNAVAIGGALALGPHASVHGDVVTIGGALRRDPGANIDGKIVDLNGMNGFAFGRVPWRNLRFVPFAFPFLGAAAGVFALMSTLMRVFVLCVLTSLVLLAGRDYIERVGVQAAAEPLKAGAVGFLAELLFVPLLVLTVVVLAITIIGIPLLLLLVPAAVLGFALVFLVGFTAIAYNVGRLANARFAWTHANPYLTALTGIALILSPVLIARLLGLAGGLLFPITGVLVFVGLLIEYLAWTVGFGAVALMRFTRPATPPPTLG